MTIKHINVALGLTPHQDANVHALDALRHNFAERIKRPGDAGAKARIQFAMLEAYCCALARERDNGIRMGAIGMGVRDAIADVVSSFVVTVALSAPTAMKVEGVEHIMKTAHQRALDTIVNWNGLDDGEISGFSYETIPTAKAD